MLNKSEMLEIFRQDVVPALGCTEPVCVALAAAEATHAAGGKATKIELEVNPNIFKNGMSVGIPGFDKVGLNYAAAIGAVLANPQKKLQLLQDLTPQKGEEATSLAKNVDVKIDQSQRALYVKCHVVTDSGDGLCVIKQAHTNVVLLQANGKDIIRKDEQSAQGGKSLNDKLHEMTVAQIRELVESASLDELSYLLQGVEMNDAVAEESLKNHAGVGISKTLQQNMNTDILKDDLMSRIMLKVASSIEGRLDGCPYTIMSSAGAGSKGLAVIIPVSETAKMINADKLTTARALAFGHLLNSYINTFIGKLSAMCACSLASATAAAAAMTYLLGGKDQQIAFCIRNMTGTITGMICDGGKVGCALKLATALSAGVVSAILAVNNVALRVSDGVCAESAEDCVKNIGKIATLGMAETDKQILDIMLNK